MRRASFGEMYCGHVEAFDLAREARRERSRVDARDGFDAALARENRGPRGGNVAAYRRNDTEPGNDDASLGHTILVVVRADGRRDGAGHSCARPPRERILRTCGDRRCR